MFEGQEDKNLRLFGGVRVENGAKKTLWDVHEFDADSKEWNSAGVIENAPKVENPSYLYKPDGALFVYGTNPAAGKEIFLSVDLKELAIKNLKNNPAGLKELSPLLDPAKGLVYFFSGVDSLGAGSKKVFAYNIDADSWSELNVKNPPAARRGAAFVINPAGDAIYMFGGADQAGKFFGDTWSLKLLTGLWSLVPLSPSPQPVKDAAFLNAGDFGILISGILNNGKINREIWHFDLSAPEWIKDLAPVTPSDRIQAAQVFSPKRRAWYLIGGLRSEINEYSPVSTIIKYSVEEETWTEKHLKIEGASFVGSAAALDDDNDTVYIHGGVK
ncbi:MAG: hypothetical protein FJ088_17055, partial [Deltaproteobacteria bacterium]|nr:hypothetical protein [Deltaproteobacteria bacterium]